MILNGISNIIPANGKYIVLAEYCGEGLNVILQCGTLEEINQFVLKGNCNVPFSVVTLVEVEITEKNP